MELFGEWLKRKRESRGMTVNQLGMYSGLTGATISRIETGKRGTPKPPTLRKLSDALKVDYEEIMQAAGYLSNMKKNIDTVGENEVVAEQSARYSADDIEILEKLKKTPEEVKKHLISIIDAIEDKRK